MKATPLSIEGAWLFEPTTFADRRGSFTAPFQGPAFREALGFDLTVAQTNQSVSARGVVRGVHYADVPPGQAKYLYVATGAVRDVVVDLRVGSPTFGRVEAVDLDAASMRAVYLSEGLGHAFQALADTTVVGYLCSTSYTPAAEHGISPLDPALALPWAEGVEPVLSDKDRAAPTLDEALAAGVLPAWESCRARLAELRG
ncbi:dTDP-4-dehydrorhamnose 3,5-epimerase family protein [Pseudonocardia alni]|uniref:dTDP-4-dehydrorhamnose 3,5-epimerase n=1 Tax=Pseudonocardia alni TaxID=33907 RepID=A0AA44ZP25_PSEA5|nr:dTDP-4-dehydrorhamnose 3,5-epimerase [Pseudonocardia alni]PKB30457.1 dTDP-4-dehydrorhamnose 3,5-epimerase [Pseudonocardia alni]